MRACPRCITTLREARGPSMVIDMCTECGGAYFDHGELAKLARDQAASFEKLEALVDPEDEPAPSSREESIACPGCGDEMERYQYAFCSGIMLDRCPKCSGLWVDEGELQAIADPIAKGDKSACRDADRVKPFFAAEARNVSVEALAGMLTRNPRDDNWL